MRLGFMLWLLLLQVAVVVVSILMLSQPLHPHKGQRDIRLGQQDLALGHQDTRLSQLEATDKLGLCRLTQAAFEATKLKLVTPLHTADSPQPPRWGVVEFAPVPRFVMSTHDPVTEDVYISGSVHAGLAPWDPYVWDLFARVLKPGGGGLVVDVGANLGYFSLMAAALGYQVVAFEPMERNVVRFLASIAHNDGFAARITVYQNAVAHETGRSVALRPTHNTTNYGNGQIAVDGPTTTTTVRLDDVFSPSTTAIELLKLDVEGFELSALDGARRLLCSGAIRRIVLEWSDATRENPECPARDGLRRLVELGYTLSDIVPDAPSLSPDTPDLPPNLLLTLRHASDVASSC